MAEAAGVMAGDAFAGIAMPEAAGVAKLRPAPECARYSLRVAPENAASLARGLGVTLPERINRHAGDGEKQPLVMMLGPDDWLILAKRQAGKDGTMPTGHAAGAIQLSSAVLDGAFFPPPLWGRDRGWGVFNVGTTGTAPIPGPSPVEGEGRSERNRPESAPPHALVDVSERFAGLIVEGPAVEDVLAAGCPLPLDPERFPVGRATRTMFHRVEVVLLRIGVTTFRLECGRSFVAYVAHHLGVAIRHEAALQR